VAAVYQYLNKRGDVLKIHLTKIIQKKAALLFFAFGTLFTSHVHADAWNGKTLYSANPPSGGAACAQSGCHNANPATNTNKILNGANKAALISSAITGNTGGMGILKNKWTTAEIADIAAYLGNLNVTAPVVVVGVAVAQVAPSPLNFVSTIQGQAAGTQTVTLSNTGNANLTISTVSLTSTSPDLQQDFSAVGNGACGAGGVIAGGSSCTFTIGFTPKAVGARSASLSIAHNVGTSTVTLQGTGAVIPTASISVTQPTTFANTVINGAALTQNIVITNSGTANLQLSAITISGAASSAFAVQNNPGNCTASSIIAPTSSCTITIAFAPTSVATFSGQLVVTSNAVNAANGNISFSLQGTGTAVPAAVIGISSIAVGFGNQTIGGTSGAQFVTVQNTGNAGANVSSITISGSPTFTIVNAAACPATLAASTSCTLQIVFKPTAVGPQTGNLVVSSNATGSPHQVPITGTGVSLPTPSPTISQNTPFSFAATTVGQQSAALNVNVGNTGTAAFTINQVSVTGATPGDFTLGGACTVGKVISSGAPCAMTVTFAPTASGARAARVSVTTDGNTVLGFDVSGSANAIAVASAQLTPATFDFLSVTVGTASAVQRATLKNTGNQALTVNSLSVNAPFKITTDSTTCKAVPFTLNAGLQCDVTLSFEPTAAQPSTANLQVSTTNQGNNSVGPSVSSAVSGTGIAVVVDTKTAVTPVAVVTTPGATPTASTTPNTTTATNPSATTAVDTTAPAQASGTVSAATPMNIGAGGCTASDTGNDVSMFLLLIGCALVGMRRRLQLLLNNSR
jgi:Abnormal spindle-like microcephaly-assoc'd, ASPM-SPD-2-Hydin